VLPWATGSPAPFYVNATERTIMLVVCAVAAMVGLAIGAIAIGSLRRFGFLGLVAAFPVISLVAMLFLDPRADQRWLTRPVLVALLVLIAWRRCSGVLLWPVFFALYWLLGLAMTAVGSGAQILRHRGGGTSVGAGCRFDAVRRPVGLASDSGNQLEYLLAGGGRRGTRCRRHVPVAPRSFGGPPRLTVQAHVALSPRHDRTARLR